MADAEYIPPASAGAIATRRELEERQPPPTNLDGIVAVIVRTADGTEIELRDLIEVNYTIDVEAPRYRVGTWGPVLRGDGSVTARLELKFDWVLMGRRG